MPKINVTITWSEAILLPRKWVNVAGNIERFRSQRMLLSAYVDLKNEVSQLKWKENGNMRSG